SREPPPLAEVAPDVQIPAGLEAVLQRGLAKISGERIATAIEYAQALDEVTRAAGFEVPMLPRASGQLPIPAGPHSLSTPPPGFLMTPVPSAYATPMPGMTPATGTPMSTMTPAAGT